MSQDPFDSVLDFEDDCYKKGYQEGYEAGHKQGHLEGRELGIQTGFQRYRSLGVIQGRKEVWQGKVDNPKIETQIRQLDQLTAIESFQNDPAIADRITLQIKKAKTKLRLLAANTKSPPVELYDNALVFQKDESSIEDL